MHYTKHLLTLALLLWLTACATPPDVVKERKAARVAAEANTSLGIEYLREGKYEVARTKLDKALQLEPKYAPAHDAIAVLYEQVGEPKLAEKHYKQSLKIKPDSARAHNNYGQFLCSQDRNKEANEQFMQAADDPFYPTPAVPLTNAGLCAARIPDLQTASDFYRQALQRNPLFAPALLQMAIVRYEEGNYLGARGYLERLQQVTEHNPQSLWLAVRTEYALQDHQAWGKYSLLLKNNFPDSKEATLLLEWDNERRSAY